MKKVKVIHWIYDCNTEADVILWFDSSEEGKFIEQHTKKPVEVVRLDNPSDFTTMLTVYAFLDKEIETFWRLKFR